MGKKRPPFVGFPVLNFHAILSDRSERERFLTSLQGFQSLRHDLHEATKAPLMSSLALSNAVLGKHHYTAVTYRRYYVWEFEGHRVIANKDYGYDIEIRGDIEGMIWAESQNPEHLEAKKRHIWNVWAEARRPFEEFVANAKIG